MKRHGRLENFSVGRAFYLPGGLLRIALGAFGRYRALTLLCECLFTAVVYAYNLLITGSRLVEI